MEGLINSFQSMGAVDGPGLRFVVFVQGCPLRCIYCHNPETRQEGGTRYTAASVCEKALRYRPYFGEEGGVTLSGGEPLAQAPFTAELFARLKQEGIHTALDTSGAGDLTEAARVLAVTDLVLCDLKFSTEEDYQTYAGGSLKHTLSFLKLTEERGIPVWIRHVVAPSLTDSPESIRGIRDIAGEFSNVRRIEWLPYKNICAVKYRKMGIPFRMGERPSYTQQATDDLVRAALSDAP